MLLNTPERSDKLYAQWIIARDHGGVTPKLSALSVWERSGDHAAMVASVKLKNGTRHDIELPGPAGLAWQATVDACRDRYRLNGAARASKGDSIKICGITMVKRWPWQPWYEQHVRARLRELAKPMPLKTPYVTFDPERIAA